MAKHRSHAARKHLGSHYARALRPAHAGRSIPQATLGEERKERKEASPLFLQWPFYLFEKMMSPWRNTTSVISWMDSWRIGNRLTVPKSKASETATAYHYMIDLPGVARDRISLRFEHGEILLHVEGRPNRGGKQRHRRWSAIRRAFALPVYTDSKAITANLKDEILTINIPKTDRPSPQEPRTISIR